MNVLAFPVPMTAGQKAAATRRARAAGLIPPAPSSRRQIATAPPPGAAAALAAFEQAAASEAPDWHAAALALRKALQAASAQPATLPRRAPLERTTGRPTALPAPVLDDYPLKGRLVWCPPVIICGFADGQVVRMSFASIVGKPLNIANGLRCAITAYRFRMAGRFARHAPHAEAARAVVVPEIAYCAVRRDDAEIATYGLELVNAGTAEWRAPK